MPRLCYCAELRIRHPVNLFNTLGLIKTIYWLMANFAKAVLCRSAIYQSLATDGDPIEAVLTCGLGQSEYYDELMNHPLRLCIAVVLCCIDQLLHTRVNRPWKVHI